ncbi:MAG: TIGR02147 family protein [Bdellovibrionales bacterium]
MWIAEFTNYKNFLKESIKAAPKNGRGRAAALARHLKTSPIVVSQILNQDRELTQDQAVKVAAFFGLDERATEYFIFMVGFSRAESKDLKAFYENKMDKIRLEARKLKSNVVGKEFLSEAEKGVFYSNWYYAAVSCLVSIKGNQTLDAISNYFSELPKAKIVEITSFLVASGICNQEGGYILPGVTSSFVSEPSPYLNNHRRNWRLKAVEAFSEHNPESIHTSFPVSVSKKDSEIFRKELHAFVKSFSERIAPSPEEKLMCLNIDWFEF